MISTAMNRAIAQALGWVMFIFTLSALITSIWFPAQRVQFGLTAVVTGVAALGLLITASYLGDQLAQKQHREKEMDDDESEEAHPGHTDR